MIVAAEAKMPLLTEPKPKGHDRTVLLDDIGYYAVFDGAGDAFASQIAEDEFVKLRYEENIPDLRSVFGNIHRVILHNRKGNSLTTATAVAITSDRFSGIIEFAHAGDSALYLYDHGRELLTRLTRDEAPRKNRRIDASNFLGHPEHMLRQYGRIALPDEATILLFSDGIADDYNRAGGVSDKVIRDLLATDVEPQTKADILVATSSIEDDMSAIVIEYRSEPDSN